jgi:hypothetical protein
MMDEMFRALLIQRRRQEIIRTKGSPKIPKPPVPHFPALVEIRYSAWLQRLLKPMADISKQWARNEYPKALEAYRRDSGDLHLDEDSHSLVLSLTDPLKQNQESMDLDTGAASIDGTSESVNAWVAKRFAMERQIILGTVYDTSEPWVQAVLTEWTETNRKLVKSLVGEHLSRMESMALEAVQLGKRPEQLTLDILKANKALTVTRAKLIARDQIGKLTSLLTERRSRDLGLDTYVWRTALDERVRGNPKGRYPTARPSHWGAEGKVGIYGKGDVWVVAGATVPRGMNDPIGAPGSPVACRCSAQSRMEDLIRPIDQSLLEDPYVLAEMGKGPWPG